MYLQYGNYQHDSGEVQITVAKSVMRSPAGIRTGFEETLTIDGKLHGNDPDDLTNRLYLLEQAYSSDYKDVGLYQDSGALTQHFMKSANALGGVRVASFSYGPTINAEYTTYRTYQAVLTGKFLTSAANTLLAWVETLAFRGTGGPRFVMQQPLVGVPQKWQVASRTPCFCTQSGSAVGMLSRPTPPPPLFPAHEHVDRRQITPKGPEIVDGGLMNYGIEWTYEFESVAPLIGYPTLPP